MKIPTDFTILSDIYKHKYAEFCEFSKENKSRSYKIYVPIDIVSIAARLNVDPDIVFGRLYYHLENKYSYQKEDDSWVHFFMSKIGEDSNVVNFPLLASVLAGLSEERNRNRITLILSVVAITISISTFVLKTVDLNNQPLPLLEKKLPMKE